MIYILQMSMQTFFFFQLFPKENKLEGRSEVLLGPDDNIEILNYFMNIIVKHASFYSFLFYSLDKLKPKLKLKTKFFVVDILTLLYTLNYLI